MKCTWNSKFKPQYKVKMSHIISTLHVFIVSNKNDEIYRESNIHIKQENLQNYVEILQKVTT